MRLPYGPITRFGSNIGERGGRGPKPGGVGPRGARGLRPAHRLAAELRREWSRRGRPGPGRVDAGAAAHRARPGPGSGRRLRAGRRRSRPAHRPQPWRVAPPTAWTCALCAATTS